MCEINFETFSSIIQSKEQCTNCHKDNIDAENIYKINYKKLCVHCYNFIVYTLNLKDKI